MPQDTGKYRKNTKDQYYTKESIAEKCIKKIIDMYPNIQTYEWIEPSAGKGVFLKRLPSTFHVLGIDIEPKYPSIQEADFLTWSPIGDANRIFFGNPPFGRQSCLAKAFIKHAAKYANIIAFILPRSFIKPSMSRVFPLKFHCVYTCDLEKNSFEVNNMEHDVPCIFQIWEKRNTLRIISQKETEIGFQYVKVGEPFHIACKRVGGLAGKCYTEGDFNPNYHYFLKLDDIYIPHIQTILEEVNSHTFPTNTVGPRSLSKGEINEVLNIILISI